MIDARRCLILFALLAVGNTECSEEQTVPGEHPTPNGKADGAGMVDPLYRNLPSGLTTDVGSVETILEPEHLDEACERHFARLDPDTEKFSREAARDTRAAQRDLVLCGKYLFFNLPVPTDVAVPDRLLKAWMAVFGDLTGPALTHLGFRENPFEPGMPLEFAVAPNTRSGPLRILQGRGRVMTCAACHLGRLPDGRFSVGMPNEELDLGTFSLLSQYLLWLASSDREDDQVWDRDAQAFFRDLRDESRGVFHPSRVMFDAVDALGSTGLGEVLYDFVGQDPVPLTDQRTFLMSEPGVLNGTSPMLSDPETEIYIATPAIWEMQHYEDEPLGEPYLGRVASSRSLEELIRQGYVFSTMSGEYATPKWVDPIAAYVRTLEAPRGPEPTAESEVGAGIFARDCAGCHDGHGGATSVVHPLDAAGTPLFFDEVLEDYVPPNRQSIRALAELRDVGLVLPLHRKGIKSRRLTGIWARSKLGYNGAIEGLNHLLCLDGRVRSATDRSDPLADSMHAELCTRYSEPERLALRAHLETL